MTEKSRVTEHLYSFLNPRKNTASTIFKVLVKKRVGKYSIIYTASKLCVAMSFTV